MYGKSAQIRLREKLDYELWLLDFLSSSYQIFEGGNDISTITLNNRRAGTHTTMFLTDSIASRGTMKVVDEMAPLTFLSSFKILDMIFEWILQENYEDGNIRDNPSRWPFDKKIEKIHRLPIIYPPLMQSEPYIKKCLFSLYENLLKFRHEIVHNNKFEVDYGKLKVTATKKGQSDTLELDRSELGAFVRIVVAVSKILIGDLPFGRHVDRLLKYHLDRIKKLHGLREFKQRKPLLVDVILKVPIEQDKFLADLKFVRQEITRIHPNADLLFTLKIIGLVNDETRISWFFSIDEVPETDLLELRMDSYGEHRISIPDECSFLEEKR